MKILKDFVAWNRKISKLIQTRFPSVFPKDRTRALFNQAIEKHLKSLQSKEGVRILEVGGIDRPFLQKSSAYEYCGLDIEVREKCYEVYDSFIVKSIEEKLE